MHACMHAYMSQMHPNGKIRDHGGTLWRPTTEACHFAGQSETSSLDENTSGPVCPDAVACCTSSNVAQVGLKENVELIQSVSSSDVAKQRHGMLCDVLNGHVFCQLILSFLSLSLSLSLSMSCLSMFTQVQSISRVDNVRQPHGCQRSDREPTCWGGSNHTHFLFVSFCNYPP